MDFTLKTFFQSMLKRWWVLVSCVIIGFLIAFLVSSFLIEKKYSSKFEFNVSYVSNEVLADKTTTIANAFHSDFLVTLEEAIKEIDVNSSLKLSKDYTAKELKSMISASYVKGTAYTISVTITANNYEDAYNLAKFIYDQDNSSARIKEVIKIALGATNAATVLPITSPIKDAGPISPNTALNSVLGVFLGLIIGVIIALIIEKLDVRIKDEEDLLSKYDLPVLGIIPNFPEIEEVK